MPWFTVTGNLFTEHNPDLLRDAGLESRVEVVGWFSGKGWFADQEGSLDGFRGPGPTPPQRTIMKAICKQAGGLVHRERQYKTDKTSLLAGL